MTAESSPAIAPRITRDLTRSHIVVMLLCATMLVGNFYCNDLPGSLSTPLRELLGASFEAWQWQLNLLYTVYSVPNLVLPVIAGYLCDRFGTHRMLLLFTSIVFAANTLYWIGTGERSFVTLLLARVLNGFGGEALDIAATMVGTIYFQDTRHLSLCIGVLIMACRLSGAVQTSVSPRLSELTQGGAALSKLAGLALWVCGPGAAALLGTTLCLDSLIAAIALYRYDTDARRIRCGVVPVSMDALPDDENVDLESPLATHMGPAADESLVAGSDEVAVVASTAMNAGDALFAGDDHVVETKAAAGWFRTALPFPPAFWILVALTLCLAACVAPFIHIASDFFMARWYPDDLQLAGTLMGIPNLVTAIGAPLLGSVTDRLDNPSIVLPVSASLLLLAHTLLFWTAVPPIVGVLLLGLGCAAYSGSLWTCVPLLVPSKFIGTGYGVTVVAVNLSLAAVPLAIAGLISASGNFESTGALFVGMSASALVLALALCAWDHTHGNRLAARKAAWDPLAKLLGDMRYAGSPSPSLLPELPARPDDEILAPFPDFKSFRLNHTLMKSHATDADYSDMIEMFSRESLGGITLAFNSRQEAENLVRSHPSFLPFRHTLVEKFVPRPGMNRGSTERVVFSHRRIADVVGAIVSNPALLDHIDLTPHTISDPVLGRIYASPAQCYEWARVAATLGRDCRPAFFTLASRTIDVAEGKRVWAIYLALANLAPAAANREDLGAAHLLGYMPIPIVRADADEETTFHAAGTLRLLTHECLRVLFDQQTLDELNRYRSVKILGKLDTNIVPILYLCNALWPVPLQGASSIHERIAVDPAGQLHLGVTKNFVVPMIRDKLLALADAHPHYEPHDLLEMVCYRIKASPRPRSVSPDFNPKRILLPSESDSEADSPPAARDYQDLMRVIVPALAGIVEPAFLDIVTHHATFCTLIEAAAPCDLTLNVADHARSRFHDALLAAGLDPPNSLEYHTLSEYMAFIRDYGPLWVASMERFERLDRDHAQALPERINWSVAATKQMADRVAQHDLHRSVLVQLATVGNLKGYDPKQFERLQLNVDLGGTNSRLNNIPQRLTARSVTPRGQLNNVSMEQLNSLVPHLHSALATYLRGLSVASAALQMSATWRPGSARDIQQFKVFGEFEWTNVSPGSFLAERMVARCMVAKGATADWVLYSTSIKSFRVGRLKAVLEFTHGDKLHRVAIVERFGVRRELTQLTNQLYPAQLFGLTRIAAGHARHQVVPLTSLVSVVHAVPNYDRPDSDQLSEFREWFLNPYDDAGSLTLLLHPMVAEALE
ncbi:hypothetical protein H9P43_007324 [Blastocladiella emersonii ATCC 22665]|nr:hypothetical protein H9P43_007324 [Blastocladiella emersonii ATCC 22665]